MIQPHVTLKVICVNETLNNIFGQEESSSGLFFLEFGRNLALRYIIALYLLIIHFLMENFAFHVNFFYLYAILETFSFREIKQGFMEQARNCRSTINLK